MNAIHPDTLKKYQRIWKEISHLKSGDLATYGQIAERAGMPRQARLVARALRHAPDDLNLPWFRVVGAGLKISIPLETSGGQKQAQLLRNDGHTVNGKQIKPASSYSNLSDLDTFLWGPDS